ncbi:MAG: ATP-binding cassette domain-containing protein [Candidatus Latescibacterota bacterium]|nr:ATP-binding cassette domain-containing protein [Candidatus Latescibacterota bacterium]
MVSPCPAIEAQGLTIAYDDQLIINEINLLIENGDITIIIGGSGCGKSTLLKSLIGLIPHLKGRLQLLGRDMSKIDENDQRDLSLKVGVMFQFGALLNSLTIAENVALPLEMHTNLNDDIIKDIVRTRLDSVSLLGSYNYKPDQLSGGMRKRAALARAMVLEPEILLCDEPVAGLDPTSAAEIDDLLLTINKESGTTLLIVTHDLLSINRINGNLLMLDDGHVIFQGSRNEALQSNAPKVYSFFHPGNTDD